MEQKKEQEGQLQELMDIVEKLRAKDGCPWDRVQTHDSLKSCVVEEAAELTAAIRIYDQTGSCENLREELGDLLLQVAMHSQIAKEEGLFTIEDVIHEVSEKMIRRHPHVFMDTTVKDNGEIRANWEEIKAKEKEGKDWILSPLREIPPEFPALTRAVKIVKKVDKLYESQPDAEENCDLISNLLEPLKEAVKEQDQEKTKQLLAAVLIQLSGLAYHTQISLEQVLTDQIEDIIERFEPDSGSNIIKS